MLKKLPHVEFGGEIGPAEQSPIAMNTKCIHQRITACNIIMCMCNETAHAQYTLI